MTRKFEFLKKSLSTLFASTLMIGLLFVAGCGGDDEPAPEEYEIPGTYTFAEAILQTAVTIPLPEPIGSITIGPDENITEEMAGGLLAAAGCDNPSNGAVVMSADNKLYFTCLTETTADTDAGTWALNSAQDKLTLYLSVPQDLSLSIDDLVINEVSGEIGGTIYNFPLTPDLLAGFLQGYGLTQEQIDGILSQMPPATFVDVDIVFDKVS